MSDSETISSRRTEFLAAFNRESVEAMAEFLVDDHISMPPNRSALKGIEATRRFWQEGFALVSSRFVAAPEDLVVVGDVGIDRFHWSMDSTPRAGGSTIHDEGNCIWIWHRQPGNSWKVAQAIWNSDVEAVALGTGADMVRSV